MRLGGRFLLAVLVVVVLWFGPSPAATQPFPRVRATLTGYEETPTLSTAASGSFVAHIGADAIDYELSYEGVQTGVLQAHIHLGRPAISGGISAFLCSNLPSPPPGTPACPTTSGTVTGTITPSSVIGPAGQGIAAGEFDELVRAILNGATYANVHSTAFPAGEIRGQITGVAGN